ncbi:glutamine amidotransferase [Notoacmeibacter marinus]|uniref:glutamine amidotransferase n=1 Tax=Notoacmeibacter marinus TaxID=1876515 RepID=UPI000DF2D8A6|nr:glutamine amidotransferase [Notoacmeibacter marinus]
MVKTAVAIRHVHFEDLGTFEAALSSAGYRVHYYDLGVHDLRTLDPLRPELMIVLGGPVGVGQADLYPFLTEELDLLRTRLAENRPTLGLCLGAQQIAAALGAKVASMGEKEIGFSELSLTEAGRNGPLRHLAGVPVLHWHGDAFQIPDTAACLASTPVCQNQAFALGSNVLALQFHPEVDACAGVERWLVGHAAELAMAGKDLRELREQAEKMGPTLRDGARKMLMEWLKGLTE